MKKVERKKKPPLVKQRELPRRYSSISSLSGRKSDSKKDVQEVAKENEKLQKKLDEIETQYDTDSKQSMAVIEEILPPAVQSFVPQLYHFRLPGGSGSSLDSSFAETPPFWLLLDHTLGVIWTLFSPHQQTQKLGVSELHWALEFLKGIRPSRGEHPKDVKVCINAVEDKLIELYSRITNKTDGTIGTSSSGLSSSSLLPSNGLRKVSGSVLSLGRYMDNMRKRSFLSTADGRTNPGFPLSVTYEEVLDRSPRSLQQLYRAEPKKLYENEDVIIEENVDLQPSKSNVSVPYNKLVEFLTDWRREQVDRIQNELKRLHSIEELMGSLEKEDFHPFVDGHLPQKLSEMKSTLVSDLAYRSPSMNVTERAKTPERG